MDASLPGFGRVVSILTAGALALGLFGCAGASPPALEATSAPPATSAPEVAIVPDATPSAEASSTEASEPSPPKTVFQVYRAFKEDPQLMLTRVKKQPDSLEIDFLFTNKGNIVQTIKLAPAGDPNAMFVELPDGRQLAFKSAEGISLKPTFDRIGPGEKQRFSVTFEPLPEGVTRFHVYEGAGAKAALPGQSQFWFFRNIQLK